MENVKQELKTSIEELKKAFENSNTIELISLINEKWNACFVKNSTLKAVNEFDYNICVANTRNGVVSLFKLNLKMLSERATLKSKVDKYILENGEKIKNANSLIGSVIMVKNTKQERNYNKL